jgi:glycosyltransferase involved in cell wall biosynthesis
MKRVLILTNSFPPVNEVCVYRYLSCAQYLRQHGWTSVVLTPEWTLSKRTYFERRMGLADSVHGCSKRWDPHFNADESILVERVPFQDPQEKKAPVWREWWAKHTHTYAKYVMGDLPCNMLRAGRVACQRTKFDAIISGGDPEYLFRVASQLCWEWKIPWIADYRDVVDQFPVTTTNPVSYLLTHLARRVLIARNNRHVQAASARVTVSEGFAEILRARNRIPVHVIRNGFDPNDFRAYLERARKANACFTVTYGGTLYDVQDPSVFLDGIDLFLEDTVQAREKMQVVFFGQSSDAIRAKLSRMKHRDVIVFGGTVTRPDMVERYCASDILLLVPAQGSARGKGHTPAKLFEYLGSERPILSAPEDGDITDRILAETKAGVVATTPGAVARQVRAWYREWCETGTVASRCLKQEVYKYTRQSQAKQMAEVLDEVSRD